MNNVYIYKQNKVKQTSLKNKICSMNKNVKRELKINNQFMINQRIKNNITKDKTKSLIKDLCLNKII